MAVRPLAPHQPVRALAAVPAWRWWVAGSFLARLPLTMVVIALVLSGRRLGSYGLGAGLSGIFMLGAGAGAQWRGRLLDRRELRRGIVGELVAVAVAFAVLAVLVQLRTLALLAPAVLAAGVASSAVMAGYRSFLADVVGPASPAVLEGLAPDLLAPAYAFDAVLVEVAFVSGPAVAGGLALLIGPVGVLATIAGFGLLAAWVSGSRLPERHPVPMAAAEAPPPWADRLAVANYLVTFAAGSMLGLVEAGFAPLAVSLGAEDGVAGALSAAYALGSAVGGLTFATRLAHRADPGRRGLVLVVVLSVFLLPLALAPSIPVLLGLLVLAGLPFSTANASSSSHLQARMHPARATEGFALATTSVFLGVGAGNGVAAAVLALGGSPRALYLVAALPPLVAVAGVTAWSAARRRAARATATSAA